MFYPYLPFKFQNALLLHKSGTDRATKDFCLSLSEEGQHWTEAVCGCLAMNDNQNCHNSYLNHNVTYDFDPMTVKYARFQVRSFYGIGAALEFFDLRGPEDH